MHGGPRALWRGGLGVLLVLAGGIEAPSAVRHLAAARASRTPEEKRGAAPRNGGRPTRSGLKPPRHVLHVCCPFWEARVSVTGYLLAQCTAQELMHAFMCRLHDHPVIPPRPEVPPEAARPVAARRASYAPHGLAARKRQCACPACSTRCCASAGTASNAKKQSAIHSKKMATST